MRENRKVESRSSGIVGIDFGTTNSSIAYADGGQVRMVQFPSTLGESRSSRSLLYFQRRMKAATKSISAWTGARAIEEYLAHDSADESVQGRLIQSLKSHLSDPSLTGSEVFGRRYLFEDLVARILRDLRTRASEVFGFEVTHAVAGRPVMFVGADSESDNEFAVERLRKSFLQAGFTDVRFAMEPVAAAYAYEADKSREEILLIGDFGGGTTDFSLLRVTPNAPPQVLGNTGVGIAGDALDARIVRRLVSPALGSESEAKSFGKLLPALPAWIFSNLERWHTLSFLRTHEVREMMRTAEKRALEPEKIAALRTVVEHDLGYRLHQAVQRVKVDLSAHDEAVFDFDAESIHLKANVTRASFNQWISPELQRMEASLDELLQQANISRSQVDRVFLTGGTSLVPAVRQVFTSRFGDERVQTGDVFTSVAHGLALIAQENHNSST